MTTQAAPDNPIDVYSMDQCQEALALLPDERQAAIAAANVKQLRRLKHREMDLQARIAEIRVSNLKGEVDRWTVELGHAVAKQASVLKETAGEIAAARADHAAAQKAGAAAERRHASAINAQGYASANVDTLQARIREATALLHDEMRKLERL